MIATKQNFQRYKGDNYPIRLTLYKEEEIRLNITNSTIILKIANALGTEIEKTVTADLIDPLNGVAEFSFSPTTFNTLGTFKYEIEMISNTNITYTIANGTITVIQDLG